MLERGIQFFDLVKWNGTFKAFHTQCLMPHVIIIDKYELTMMALRKSDIWYMVFARRMTTNVGSWINRMVFSYWRFSFMKASVWCVQKYGIIRRYRFELNFDFWVADIEWKWLTNEHLYFRTAEVKQHRHHTQCQADFHAENRILIDYNFVFGHHFCEFKLYL